jgi:hypothetical protein
MLSRPNNLINVLIESTFSVQPTCAVPGAINLRANTSTRWFARPTATITEDLLRQHYLQRHTADTCFRLNSLTLFPADVDPHDW